MNEVDSLRQEVGQLRAEIDRVDDWANGLLLVLTDLLPPLLRKNPDIAAILEPSWRSAAQRFAATSAGQSDDFAETPELLEGRKILYGIVGVQKAWPAQEI